MSVERLGKYRVTLPPTLTTTELVEYIVDIAQSYAEENDSRLVCVVPLKRYPSEGLIEIAVYVDED